MIVLKSNLIMYFLFYFLLHPSVALTHTAACVGFELGFGGGWRECVVRRFLCLRSILHTFFKIRLCLFGFYLGCLSTTISTASTQ